MRVYRMQVANLHSGYKMAVKQADAQANVRSLVEQIRQKQRRETAKAAERDLKTQLNPRRRLTF